MNPFSSCLDATATAESIRSGEQSASHVVQKTLEWIEQRDPELNCFTEVLTARALAQAEQIDRNRAAGQPLGVLAGVPFGVKNLFDVHGIPTLAGSRIQQDTPAATTDALVIQRLTAAGAVLVGAQNMDEYAYGFTTENHHYGATHNPHALDRVAGGSSGGSAAAVAAGLVPVSLGSDTNGSVRVPAALCGIYGLKPTYGLIPRTGMFPFVHSLDHVGFFANSVRDVGLILRVLTDRDPDSDPAPSGIDDLKIATLGGYFRQSAWPEALAAVDQVSAALAVSHTVEFPEAALARSAAFILTASEGGSLHLERLRERPQDFDPATRDRLMAGSLLPAPWITQAHRVRSWCRQQMQQLWQEVDVLLAPATPYPAPLIGQSTITVDGQEILVRPNLGLFTQPISFLGLPVLTVPVLTGSLPLGVQLIAPPHQEVRLLRVAAHLAQVWERPGK
ncbi:MAG: AtzE family amidohydrolase [Synechococcales cyanobacterium]